MDAGEDEEMADADDDDEDDAELDEWASYDQLCFLIFNQYMHLGTQTTKTRLIRSGVLLPNF